MIKFSRWLRTSNEAKPHRDAMALIDKMPLDFGLKAACFIEVQRITENTWEKTKDDLKI